MQPQEPLETRLKMVEMHDEVLDWYNKALNDELYIDACWYAYSCFESRIDRAISKIAIACPIPKRKNRGNPTGITTKIECLIRLCRSGHPFLKDLNPDMLCSIKGWCSERNDLVHDLVTLEKYPESNQRFKSLAIRSKKLVAYAYESARMIRLYYYESDSVPSIPDECAKKCRCTKKRCVFLPSVEESESTNSKQD